METMEYVRKYEAEMVETRRKIHQHPELSNQEFDTTKLVKERLAEYGIEIAEIGMSTGCVGIIRGGKSGKTLALREDMDALAMPELSGVSFASDNPNKNHACGHDIHTAILLFCAKILSEIKEELSGNIMLLFQPAEENGTGARELVSCKFNEVLRPDAFLGVHVAPEVTAGYIGLKKGPTSASVDVFSIRITGLGGHGARPYDCIDPIAISINVINQLQLVISRENNPVHPAVLTVGSIHGGTAPNIIPDYVEMTGTLRSLNQNSREKMKKAIERIVKDGARTLRGRGEVKWTNEGLPPLVNDGDIIDEVAVAAGKTIGSDKIVKLEFPSMGSEDFSVLFPEYGPGAQFKIGSGNDTDPQTRAGNHNTKIIFDEKCLATGLAVIVQFTRDYLK